MSSFPGIYLAKVVSSVDAEKRFRACVRVYGVHSRNVADADLPWAEYCALTGRMRGDFFPFHTGDDVFVMFLRGDSNNPVIVGGRVSTAQGVTDAPIPYQTDVTTSDSTADYKRWDRVDAAGNRVCLSEKAGELHVLLQSGGASVEVTQRRDAIYLRAAGAVVIQAPSAVISAGVADVSASTINIDATDGDNVCRSSGGDMILMAEPISVVNPSGGDVNIGGEAPRLRGISLPPITANTLPQQCGRTNLRSQVINIGCGTTGVVPLATSDGEVMADFDGVAPLLPTLTINIRSTLGVNIHTAGSVDVMAATASVTAASISMTGSVSILGALSVVGDTSILGTTSVVGDTSVVGPLNVNGVVTALNLSTPSVASYNTHIHTSSAPGSPTSTPA